MKLIFLLFFMLSHLYGFTFEDYMGYQKEKEKQFRRKIDDSYKIYTKLIASKWGNDEVCFSSQHEAIHYDNNFSLRDKINYQKNTLIIESITKDVNKFNHRLNDLRDSTLQETIKKNPIRKKTELKLDKKIQFVYKKIIPKKTIIKKDIKTRIANNKTIYFVKIPFKKDSIVKLVNLFIEDIEKYTKRYHLNKSYVLGIIDVESSFNIEAESKMGALGLMQLVPSTGARDAYFTLTRENKIPSRDYILNPKNNIELGCLYIYIIQNKYLHTKNIYDDKKVQFITSTSYNAGVGTLKKSFKNTNIELKVNNMTRQKLYEHLKNKKHFTKEARQYFTKVDKATKYWESKIKK